MQQTNFNQLLLEFLAASPTPFHAVEQMAAELDRAGFERLDERQRWQLKAGGRYQVIRNGSALIAFTLPAEADLAATGLRLIGAHTDSPCLKVQPLPERLKQGYFQLGVEVYGGALLNPWFDRDLSLAGRVSYAAPDGQLGQALVDFKNPVAVIPSLAIHLDREQNSNRSINPHQHLPLLLSQPGIDGEKPDLRGLLKQQLQRDGVAVERVLDFELCCYDVQRPAMVGLDQAFIASARLDNLLSCFVGLQCILADQSGGAMLVCNDHEEVGSESTTGAQGQFLESVIERLVPEVEERNRLIANSQLISADNAHGVHPNFSDRHDANHGPLLNRGPVIKVNANQRYATNSETSARLRQLAEQEQVPLQVFSVRPDMGCGSTIGPLTASRLGIETLDIGVPTFGMHSIRELAGRDDAYSLYRLLRRFQNRR
ncbi:M18 family aminopeptidase [Motiliproteus sediminis]|uniref:M18 family aminopeptidase n=1 Tax=Motiliproteus sediminis TaxID=1468178 RepID=UPI001AF01A9B|nr:M18 family aminopeptidase [Motiliproteus sediminis]